MATSSSRANTSSRTPFLSSSQFNPSTEDFWPLLRPEPPPCRPSHSSTASALAPARPVPAFRQNCSMLGYSMHVLSGYLGFPPHNQQLLREEDNHYCWKIFPHIPFLSKTLTSSAWGRASPMDGAGPHASTSLAARKRRRKPFLHQHQGSLGLSRH